MIERPVSRPRRAGLVGIRIRLATCLAAFATGLPAAQALVGDFREDAGLAGQVVMVLKRSGRVSGFCSALVLSRTAVLTAAHCVATPLDTRIFFRDGNGKPVLLAVGSVAVHPGFRPDAPRTRERSVDLALVKLAQSLPDGFQPAVLAGADPLPLGTKVHIAGYGLAREGDARSGGTLRSGELWVRAPLSDQLLWLAGPKNKPGGACDGDSGGPIFLADGRAAAISDWAQGEGAARCGVLTQAARIGPHRDWIAAQLKQWAAAP
jgi:hypothetical protein